MTTGQRVVFDRHKVGGVARRRNGLGDDERDRFADMDHTIASKGWPMGDIQRLAVAAFLRPRPRYVADGRHVGSRENGDDAVASAGFLDRYAPNASMPMLGTHEDTGKLALVFHVVGEATFTIDKPS